MTWNPAAERIFGQTSDEMVGKPPRVIIPELFHAAHDEGIRRITSGGDGHVIGNTAELSAIHKDGQEFPIELSLATSW